MKEVLKSLSKEGELEDFLNHLNEKSEISVITKPVYCVGNLSPWNDLKKGEISSEVIIAEKYYMNSPNPDAGETYEERRVNLERIVKVIFTKFIDIRTVEYKSVRCHYRGVDWNQAGNSSWKTIYCKPELRFVQSSLKRTQNGDWKSGPHWLNNFRAMKWKTGGHRHSETFAELDAIYFNVDELVIAELNTAREVLTKLGIPTQLP